MDGCTVLRPRGELCALNYRSFTDDLIKFAMDVPQALIVVLDDLLIPGAVSLSAFAKVWMRIGEWPGVPLLLVAASAELRGRLVTAVVHRFVPAYATMAEALVAAADPPLRFRSSLAVAPTEGCDQRARQFVERTCDLWAVPELRIDALVIVTELVENAFQHCRSSEGMVVRMELRDELLTVAVSDSDPREAVLREPTSELTRFFGLHAVALLALAWGCAPRWPNGKVVWATLPTARREERPGRRTQSN
ncbi:STAS domain-containing protein [Nocardia sp. NPDC051052]|uniref:STAS domain-containing protein n=1 Tax=Nocardia sp. NPDC051052 TaxID=3364322 RepID=UPI00379A7CF9